MTVISLTSIPPRFGQLGPVLECLLAQGANRVVLALSRSYQRFPGPVTPPPLPHGVELLWCGDIGPGAKLVPAQAMFPDAPVAYCDDDCLYTSDWLSALRAGSSQSIAAAGSVFDLRRLKRRGGLVAQGFSGVLLPAGFQFPPPPGPCRNADDLWFSAQMELAGLEVAACPTARNCVTPLDAPEGLQQRDRSNVYADAACHIHDTLGIWPSMRRA